MDELPVASRWMLGRIDRRCYSVADELIENVVEELAIATAAAATVRILSVDGRRLSPVAAHHPDPGRWSAILKVMAETDQPADSGLWRVVLDTRRPARWQIDEGAVPPEASDHQAHFVTEHTVRAVIGVPLIIGDDFVGGLALVRFAVGRPFTDDDETLLLACARRLAPVLHLRRTLDLAAQQE